MAVTFLQLKNHATHALQGGAPSDQFTLGEIVNDAGRHFFAMHQWLFARREPIELDLVGGQDYIALPADFGSHIAEARQNSSLAMVDPAELARQQATAATTTSTNGFYWGTIAMRRTDPGDPNAPRLPVIQIYPTPTSDQSNLTLFWYRAGWQDLFQDDQIANVPPFAESFLKLIVREFARGYENDDLPEMMERIAKSSLFRQVKVQDGVQQATLGMLRNGAAQLAERDGANFLPTEAVSDPA